MKKVVMLLVIFSGMIWGQYDYSKYDWCKTKKEIKNVESLQILEESKDSLVYKTNIYGYEATKTYIFMFDTLVAINYDIDYKNIKKFNHTERKILIENVIKEYGMFDLDSAIPYFLTDEQIWDLGNRAITDLGTKNEHIQYDRYFKWDKGNYGVVLDFMKYKKVMKNFRILTIFPQKRTDKKEYGH